MTVTHRPASDVHDPSAPPDPKALFSRLAAFSARNRRSVISIWLLVAFAAAPLALTLTHALSGAGWEAQGSTAQKVRDEIRRDFPQLGAEDPVVVYHQTTTIKTDPAPLTALVAQLQHSPHARAVANPLTLPPRPGLISPDGHTALIPVDQIVKNDAARPVAAGALGSYVGKLTARARRHAEVTGEWPVWSDFNKINAEALHKAELVSGLPTLILLFVAFGMLIAAGLPLVLALAGIAVGFALLHVLGWFMPMSVWSMNFSMMIGLAVGIDYSLFIVSRYREERVEGKDALAAIENTMSTAGKAVFLSALTVVMALAAVFLVPVMVFRSMALGMILSVVAVALASLTLLPGAARRARRPRPRPQERGRPRHHRRVPLATLDGRRAAAPGRRARHRSRRDRRAHRPRVRHAPRHARRQGRRQGQHQPRRLRHARLRVRSRRRRTRVHHRRRRPTPRPSSRHRPRPAWSTHASSLPRPRRAGSSCASPAPPRSTTPAPRRSSTRLARRLASAVPGASVGGPAAQNRDLTAVLTGRAPYAIGLILIVAFLLLLIVFRSLVVAITSILMNLLTVGAAFGFATLVFQHGFGTGLLGIEHQPFVDAWAPLFFFALLFGLSMDYQLFLLAAIRERYEATGDTKRAIAEGIARTGRPITNAALIMIIVFIAFGITGPIPPTELGLTLAMAVLLDATIVRVMLVPATMALIGERNWYLPRWLERILPHVHFSH